MAAIESVMVGGEERWIQYYSSGHSILLVGEGDFSFSLCLAMAFGSATNIVATSLDSYDELITKYKNAKANLRYLEILGASLLHGVDATKMKILPDLQCRKFHRIIYNFPHAGFHGKEDDPALINMHRSLVRWFFMNARRMLMVDGEIHLNHKVTFPYNMWGIEYLAYECSLFLVEQPVIFSIKDYPGYKNKRGAGFRCDEPFPLGECRTFKFELYPAAEKILKQRKLDLIHKMPAEFLEIPISMPHLPPPLEVSHPLGYDLVPPCVEQTSNARITTESHKVLGSYLKYVEETFGGTSYALYIAVYEALMAGFKAYTCLVPGGTWSGYITGISEELRNLSILKSEWLRQMLLASTC